MKTGNEIPIWNFVLFLHNGGFPLSAFLHRMVWRCSRRDVPSDFKRLRAYGEERSFMAYSDRELLARLIECEAGGEGDNGMKAVAGVVMNRVHAAGGEYARVGQGSIRKIIMQPGQFVCASDMEKGVYNPQNIYNMNPTDVHFEIADWAIAGNRLPDVAESLWFYNPFSSQCRSFFPSDVGYFQTRIGDHCFYNPTSAYYKT